MSIDCNSAGSARGISHGSAPGIDDLPNTSGGMLGWLWLNYKTSSATAVLMSKINVGTNGWSLFLNTTQVRLLLDLATDLDFSSTAGAVTVGVDTFIAFTVDIALSGNARCHLYVGTRGAAPAEVTYSTQTAGSGAYVTDAAQPLVVGNVNGAAVPAMSHIQSAGVMAPIPANAPAVILDIWRQSSATNAARSGAKVVAEYTDNTTLTDLTGNGNSGTLLGSAPNGTAISPPSVSSIAVTNSNVHWSPYNWYSDGAGALGANNAKGSSTYAQTNNTGAYLKTTYTVVAGSGGINLEMDNSPLGATIATGCPMLLWRVGRAATGAKVLSIYDAAVPLASGLAAGTYDVEVWYKSFGVGAGERWVTPVESVKILGLITDSDATLAPYQVKTKNTLVFGASQSEGYNVLGTGGAHADNDAIQAWCEVVRRGVLSELGNCAWSGQGFTRGISNNVASSSLPCLYSTTDANQSWNKYASGKSRLVGGVFSPAPDYVLIDVGANDVGLTAQQVTDSLNAIMTAAGSSAKMFVFAGPSITDAVAATVATGVAAVTAASRTYLLTVALTVTNATAGQFTNDGATGSQHLSSRGQMRYAADVLAGMSPYITTGGGGASGRSGRGRFGF